MRSWRGAAVTAFAAALMLLGGSGPVALASAGGPVSRPGALAEPQAGPSVEERPCPVAVPPGTTCGHLLVPERRDVPNSRTIRVGYAVHRAADRAAGQAADPVVSMSGGPGSASLQLTGFLARMLPGRDMVVLDQRGGPHSEPRLSCPEVVEGVVDALRAPGPAAGETAPVVRRALACQARLEAGHVDLRGYRTAEIAADIVDLRTALGYPRWHLFGAGYSTRPMLLAAARDPEGTGGVVLDSLLPGARWYDDSPGLVRTTMAKLGIGARFDAMVAALNARPVPYETRDPLTRERLTIRLNGDDVATILRESLHEPEVVPIVPALVDGLADGHTELLQPLVDAAGDELTSREWGLYYAVQCQDQVPYNSFPNPRPPRLLTGVLDAAVCDAWGLPAARAEADLLTPGPADAASSTSGPGSPGSPGNGDTAQGADVTTVAADGPAADATTLDGTPGETTAGETTAGSGAPAILALGGQYDPVTLSEASRKAVSATPGARFVEFAGVGHAVFLSSECGRKTIAAFLDDPAGEKRPCDPGATPHPMVRPGDLVLTSSVYRMSRSPAPLAVPAAFLLASAVQLVAGLVCLARRRGGGLSALAGLAGVVLCGLSALSLASVPDRTALAIGVPHALAWYGLLALVSTGLSIVEAFRLNARAPQIIPALAGLAFLAWLYGWLLA